MIKVLFICHGNICRSPMCESVFTHMVKEAGLADRFLIDSAATSTEEIGNPVHWGTADVAVANKKYFYHLFISPFKSCISSQALDFSGFSDF